MGIRLPKPIRMATVAVTLFGAVMGGCFAKAPSVVGCNVSADCAAGNICGDDHVCRRLCVLDDDCPGGMECAGDGACAEFTGSGAPIIDSIAGDAPGADEGDIRAGIVVGGLHLARATFDLANGAGRRTLESAYRAEDEVLLLLPATLLEGEYTLTATNRAGAADEAVVFTLPWLSGDQLVVRMNEATTSKVSVDVLPLGDTAESVAAGDHTHLRTMAGNGLIRTGDVLAVDSTQIQSRVSGVCPSGHAMIGISEQGALLCEPTIVSSFAARAASSFATADGTVSAAAATAISAKIVLPAPGRVVAIGTADIRFMNASATNESAQIGLHICKSPDTAPYFPFQATDCGPGALGTLHSLNGTAGDFVTSSLVTELEYDTAGEKEVFLNFYTNTGDLVTASRGRIYLQYIPH